MIKRSLDMFFSIVGLVLCSPIFIIIVILIKIDSKGPIIFAQQRVGKHNKDFDIFKFRTMRLESELKGSLTIGNKDPRVTKIGYYLRKYKLDELPQLLNILFGTMSFIGPRPELRKFVDYYNEDDFIVFQIRPGLTGLASIKYRNEVELIKESENAENFYIHNILPKKLKLNKYYVKNMTLFLDFKIIINTLKVI